MTATPFRRGVRTTAATPRCYACPEGAVGKPGSSPSRLRVNRNRARARRTGARSSAARSAYRLRFVRAPRLGARPPAPRTDAPRCGTTPRSRGGTATRPPRGRCTRILEPDQQRGRAAERVRERPDERDAAPRADLDRRAPVAGLQRALRGVERADHVEVLHAGPDVIGVMRSSSAPRHVRLQVRDQRTRHLLRALPRHDAHAHPTTGRRHDLVARARDGRRLERRDRKRRVEPLGGVRRRPAPRVQLERPHGARVLAERALLERERRQRVALRLRGLHRAREQPGHRDAPVGLDEGREQPRHPHHGIRHRSAPEAAVERVRVARAPRPRPSRARGAAS